MSKFNFCSKFLLADLNDNLKLLKCIAVTTIIKNNTSICFEIYTEDPA